MSSPFIVGIGGTTRAGSTTERVLQLCLARAASQGCEVQAFGGDQLALDAYDPGRSATEPARLLVEALRRADGVIIATPSYHGGMSGLIKNALDYIEELRTDARPYLQQRAVGCVVCAEGPQALGSTLVALRSVVHALRGWPTPYGAAVNTSTRPFDEQGQCRDDTVLRACETVADEVVAFARWVRAA